MPFLGRRKAYFLSLQGRRKSDIHSSAVPDAGRAGVTVDLVGYLAPVLLFFFHGSGSAMRFTFLSVEALQQIHSLSFCVLKKVEMLRNG
jgi:hypothetical protein